MSRFQYNSRFRAMYQVCYPFFLEKHTDFLSGQMRLAVRPWLLEWQKQNNSTYFKNVRKSIGRIMLSNMVQTSQQHCCMTAAGMLQVYKVVALASQQALIPRCVGLYLEYKQTVLRRREFVCMLRKGEFNTATKYVQTCVQQDRLLYSFCPNVRRCTGDEAIYNFYIRITQTIQNPINIKFEKAFNQFSLLSSQAEESTREAPSEIYVPQ